MILKTLAILLLAALLTIGIQTWRVQHYKSRAVILQSAVLTFESAQATNLATIRDLRTANAQWADKNAADVAKAKQQAEASRQSDAATIDKLTQLSKKLAERVKHDKYVEDWVALPWPDSVGRLLTEGGTH